MTNPNNAIGTPAAYNGRTGVDSFNDNLAMYTSRGVISGWECEPSSGMTVEVGGTGGRDVAVAQDASGNFVTINNRIGSPVAVTLPTAPVSNTRIDYIVAYVNNPATVTASDNPVYDNPEACGIVVASGTASSNPSGPSDATIRAAITADGGDGSQAYYAVLASVRVASGVTTITSGLITQGNSPTINSKISASFLGALYPVGSIYMSVNSTNPSSLFGGTWQRIQDTFLLAAGSSYSAGSTGGSASHTHEAGSLQADVGNASGRVNMRRSGTSAFTSTSYITGTAEGDEAISVFGTNVSGTSGSSSSMPPYLAVYVWKRTA